MGPRAIRAFRALTLGCLLFHLLSAGDAFAFPPVLYPATVDGGCTLIDNGGPVVIEVRVNGVFADASTGALFGIAFNGFAGVPVSVEFPSGINGVGDPVNGFQVQYQGCVQPFATVVRITYQMFGASQPNSTIEVVPHPGQIDILYGDCNFDALPTRSLGPITVNPSPGSQWCVLATEPTTWGSVKALYR